MTRDELLDLLAIKCHTIDQQGNRERAVIALISETINRRYPVAVPMENAVGHLIEAFERRGNG